ncbi:hypothetical protein FCOIX_13875 [Fusarium coicis]|nr:hypothetical protein FCOIX_13875 [Fusarium coicis]
MDLPVACVTVVEANEGDAFVVDLRVAKDYTKSASWNRYIVDTGFPIDIFSAYDSETDTYSAGGGPRAGLLRALFEDDITTKALINSTIKPWDDGQMPRICGMIITHTDRDHWGNATWLARYLQWAHQQSNGTFLLNPLPIYTSPMIQWLKDVAAMSKLHLTETKMLAAKDKSHKEVDARARAKDFLTKEHKIMFSADKTAKPVLKLGESRIAVEEEVTIDSTPFLNPSAWTAAFKKYEELQQTLLTEKPYCSLAIQVTKRLKDEEDLKRWNGKMDKGDRRKLRTDETAWIKEYIVRWHHKPLTRTVGCSFNSIPDLAAALGYTINYRFNLQKRDFKLDEPDLTMLMRPLTHEWINENTTSAITTWTERSNFKPTEDQLRAAGAVRQNTIFETFDEPVLVIAEVRLVPPKITAKRSYPVGPNDPNAVLAGDWLRLMSQHRFVETGLDKPDVDTDAVEQIKAVVEKPDFIGLDDRLVQEDTGDRPQITAVERLLHLVVEGWFAQEPEKPNKLVQDVACLGLQDTIYGLHFVLQPPVEEGKKPMDSFWKSSYSGCAGTRFSRDFLHLAAQAYLSPDQTDKWFRKAKSNSEKLDHLLQIDDDYLYNVQLVKQIGLVIDRTTADSSRKLFVSEDKKKELGTYAINVLQSRIDAAEAKYEVEKKTREKRAKKSTKNRSWGHAANRSSLITHFRFEARTYRGFEKGVSFDMLFTGDAFEIGAGESQPYAPHLRPGLKDFQIPSAVRPRTIEKQGGLFENPDGNLLSWLWQNGNLGGMRVGVLKVPHHGSSNTTNALFYRLVSASVYLISGANKPHGHPRPETLQAIINTIMREDGPARPPEDFCSEESIRRAGNDQKLLTAVRRLPPISKRLRPRMIFLTHHTCKDEEWNWEDREAEMEKLNEQKAKAREPMGDMAIDPSTIKTKKDDVLGDAEDSESSDDDLNHDAHTDESQTTKKPKKKNYIDVKQFVYFHSQYLGGFNDVPDNDYEKWKADCRQKRNLENKYALGEVPKFEIAPRANVRIFVQKHPGAASRLMFGADSSRRDQCRVEWDSEDWYEVRADDHDVRFDPKNHDSYDPFHDPVAYPERNDLPKWERDWQLNPPQDVQPNPFLELVPTDTPPVMPPGLALPEKWADRILESKNPAQVLQLGDGFEFMRKKLQTEQFFSKFDDDERSFDGDEISNEDEKSDEYEDFN